jgi:hypothetical protein
MRPFVDTCASSCKALLLLLLSALLSHTLTTPLLEAVAMCRGSPTPSAAARKRQNTVHNAGGELVK